jgi:hypothetical protein
MAKRKMSGANQDFLSTEEYEAKWAEAQRVAELTSNDPSRRRKATVQCTFDGVEYEIGDLMTMKHHRAMKKMVEVFG